MNFTFISYRRDGAEAMAQLVYDRLVSRGITVFYDIESLKSGTFNNKIYDEIDRCDNFVLILPKNGLDRCQSEGDWVRNEISYALAKKKNIIPMMMRGFEFPDDMPDDIKAVKLYQGVNIENMDFFDAKIDKLIGMMTKSDENQEIAKLTQRSDAHVVVHHDLSKTPPSSQISSVHITSTARDGDIPPLNAYSCFVHLKKMSAIWFKVNLTKEVAKEEVTLSMKIYSKSSITSGVLIAKKSFTVNVAPDCHRISLKWDGRKYDGNIIEKGAYFAVLEINESGSYVFDFTAINEVPPHDRRYLRKVMLKRIFPFLR